MKNKLPALTAAILLAAGGYAGYRSQRWQRAPVDPVSMTPSSAGAADAVGRAGSSLAVTAGDQLMVQARTQLERRARVTARLRHQVTLADHQLRGVGNYWQQGSGDELRVRLELQMVGDESNLLQVSNGRFLWTDRRLAIGRSITRLDLRKLRNEMTRATLELDEFDAGPISSIPIQPDLSLYNGGLPTLLATLAEHFTFLPPQSMRWTPDPPLAGLSESFPVFAVVGHWKPPSLASLAPAAGDVRALPERLPQEVLVLLGQSDLFPYRIEFRKLLHPTSSDAATGRTAAFQLSRDPLVFMELESVSFDATIAAGQFDYTPGDAKFDDLTAEHLEKIRRDREARLAARKRDAQR